MPTDDEEFKALEASLKNNKIENFKKILHDFDVNQRDSCRMNCLVVTCRNASSSEFLKLVIEKIVVVGGIDMVKRQLTATKWGGRGCFESTCYSSSPREVMKLLLSALCYFDLFKEQWTNLPDYAKQRLYTEFGIESDSWTPDSASAGEVKELLERAAEKKTDEDQAAAKEIKARELLRRDSDDATKKQVEQEVAAIKEKAKEEAAATKKKAEEEAAVIKKKAEEEAAVIKKKAEEEAAVTKKKAEEEAAAKKKAEEEAALLRRISEEIIEMRNRSALKDSFASLQQEKMSLVMKLHDSQEKVKWLDSINYSMNISTATLDELQQAIDDLRNELVDLAQIVGEQRSSSSQRQNPFHHVASAQPPASDGETVAAEVDGGDNQSTAQETTTTEQLYNEEVNNEFARRAPSERSTNYTSFS